MTSPKNSPSWSSSRQPKPDPKKMEIAIRSMTADDWAAVSRIYGEGIATGNATFATEIPDWQKWDSSHLPNCRLIASHGKEVWVGLRSARFLLGRFTRELRKCRSMWPR